MSFFVPLAVHGTIVTTSKDEDDGSLGGGSGVSLREAVKYSKSGDTLTFGPALSGDKTGNGKSSDDTRIINITTGTGIYRTSGSLSVDRSIIAGNIGSPPLNIAGTYAGAFNLTSGDPLLAPLGNYGGPNRYDGSTDTPASGVSCQRTATGITVTDANPPPGGAFYRFEAVLP